MCFVVSFRFIHTIRIETHEHKKPFTLIGCAVVVVAAAYLFGYLSVKKTLPVEPVQTENAPTRAATGSAKLYGKFVKISENGAELRLVEWVEGSDNQEQAALENGRCTLDRIEKDECLPNGFFIRETEKTMTLPISADTRAMVYARGPADGFKPNESGDIYTEEISFADFAQMFEKFSSMKELPFIFTTTNGAITKVQEQYIP